jgi:hypothetical protein
MDWPAKVTASTAASPSKRYGLILWSLQKAEVMGADYTVTSRRAFRSVYHPAGQR